jgi:hypothetical protein
MLVNGEWRVPVSKLIRWILLVGLVSVPMATWAQSPASEDAYLYFITPRDGERVTGSFRVRFGLRNMGVTHAGDNTPSMGHHHLLVDIADPPDLAEPIPQDKKHLHFGKGQTEAVLELPPGRHTLQLVLGDGDHKPFTPSVASMPVQITVLRPGEVNHRSRHPKRKRTGA